MSDSGKTLVASEENKVLAPVTIILVTWNAVAFTKQTLSALKRTTDHPNWRVVIVDNASRDGTPEWLDSLDWITLIKNDSNVGYAKACNQGIAACGPDDDVVLLNNDLIVQDSAWLSRLQEIAYSQPRTGIVGTRLMDGEKRIHHLGSFMPPIGLYGKQMGGGELDINQCSETRSVEAIVFAQAYLRRDCLNDVGPLDEDLFAYFEDTDYCLRAARAGWDVLYTGRVRSIHYQNTSTTENKNDFGSIYMESRKTFSRKWGRWLKKERYQGQAVWNSVVHEPIGYATQSRKMMEALHFADLRISFDNAYGAKDGPTGDVLIDDLLKRKKPSRSAQIAFCRADAFTRVRGGPRIGWTMLEVTGLPPDWVDACNSMDEVWVPASFNIETFRTSGVHVPIKVMPLGVDTGYYHPEIASFRPSERFTFLSVFEWGERKGPEILLKAFADEFTVSDDVLLLLSVINNDPQVNVHEQIDRLNLPAGLPIVVMLNCKLPAYQMGALYRSADCFVLPTRGEGWGMPVLEAMACGLPTIATSWSGPADFLKEDIGYPLNVASLIPAKARCVYYKGFEWADPDTEHLRFLMRHVYENPEKALKKGLEAAAHVASTYTWSQAAHRVMVRLRELGVVST